MKNPVRVANMSLKMAFFWCLCTALFIICFVGIAQAQTNTNGTLSPAVIAAIIAQINASQGTVVTTAAVPDPITVSNFQQALGAAIHYKEPGISFGNAVVIAGALMGFVLGVAKSLRKLIPDHLQVNQAGVLLAHLAGEVNPSVAKLALASSQEVTAEAHPEIKNSPIVQPPLPAK